VAVLTYEIVNNTMKVVCSSSNMSLEMSVLVLFRVITLCIIKDKISTDA